MEIKTIKCSSKKHEINATSFCSNCKMFLCNKCLKYHSELHEEHYLIDLDKDLNDIFNDICNIKGHNNKLEFFCKNHNILCCLACL